MVLHPLSGREGSTWGIQPINAKIIARRFDRRVLLSRRDSTIVARHEVPGIMRKIARPSGTIEPIPSDPNFSTGAPGVSEAAGAFDALSLAHAGAQFRRQISVGLTITSTVPPGRGLSASRPGTSCLATRSHLRDTLQKECSSPILPLGKSRTIRSIAETCKKRHNEKITEAENKH